MIPFERIKRSKSSESHYDQIWLRPNILKGNLIRIAFFNALSIRNKTDFLRKFLKQKLDVFGHSWIMAKREKMILSVNENFRLELFIISLLVFFIQFQFW